MPFSGTLLLLLYVLAIGRDLYNGRVAVISESLPIGQSANWRVLPAEPAKNTIRLYFILDQLRLYDALF